MKKKIRIGIAGINPYSGNRGVGALAISILFLLNKIAKESGCTFELVAINYDYGKYSLKIGDEQINGKSIYPVSFFSFKDIIKLLTQPYYMFSLLEYFKLNYILCIGEGDSFSDTYGKKRFRSIDSQHRVARLLSKKYLLLPQTIGPFVNTRIKTSAKKSIEKAQIVFARDKQSLNYVYENTNQTKAFESIDVAFFMPYERKKFSSEFIHIGLNISALLWNGGYTRNNQFNLKCDYQKLIHNVIDYFLSIPNIKIHIISHVMALNSNVENDYEISYQLVNEYTNDNIILAPFFLTPISAKSYISGLDFFAGARMHSTIAAFSSGVPVFPMAYSRKFNGLFADTLEYNHIGDMLNQETDDILKQMIEAFHVRNELAEFIQTRMDTTVKEKGKQLNDKLTQILGLIQ